jgi:hypothetical protein
MTAPTTPPELLPTKVTEVGRKCDGTGAPEVVVDKVLYCSSGVWVPPLFAVGVALLDSAVWLALGRTEAGVVPLARTGFGLPAWLPLTNCGTETAAASTTAQPAAANAAWRTLRRRAR